MNRAGRLFQLTPAYDNPLAQQRAAGLFGVTWLLVLVWAGWLALVTAPALIAGGDVTWYILTGVLGAITLVTILALVQMRRLEAASWLFVGLLLVLCAVPLLVFDIAVLWPASGSALLVIPVVAAGLLLTRTGLGMVIALTVGVLALHAYLQTNAQGDVSSDLLTTVLVLMLVNLLMLVFGSQAARALDKLGRERAVLRASAGFVETLNRAKDEGDLLAQTAALIRDEMGYPLAQVMEIQDGRLTRVVRPGLAPETRAVNDIDRELVAQVIETGAPVVSTLGNQFRQRLVAPSQTALTVPVRIGDQIVAVIDVHTSDAGFSLGETEGIRQLAAQLGMHLGEHQLVEDLRAEVRELEASQSAGAVAVGLGRRQTGPLRAVSGPVRGFDLEGSGDDAILIAATELTPALHQALDRTNPNVVQEDGVQRILVPLRYRSLTLGALTLELPPERPVTERQMELLHIVSERLGQALANIRLVEQSQMQAIREHKASEAANVLITATDVRAVLALAAESFNEAMGAVATRVTLQPDAETARSERAEGVAP